MLASLPRNNMAQPAGSSSAGSTFDFFDDGPGTSDKIGKSCEKDVIKEGTNNIQSTSLTGSRKEMESLAPVKETTDISFQSIEEVIEVADDEETNADTEIQTTIQPITGTEDKIEGRMSVVSSLSKVSMSLEQQIDSSVITAMSQEYVAQPQTVSQEKRNVSLDYFSGDAGRSQSQTDVLSIASHSQYRDAKMEQTSGDSKDSNKMGDTGDEWLVDLKSEDLALKSDSRPEEPKEIYVPKIPSSESRAEERENLTLESSENDVIQPSYKLDSRPGSKEHISWLTNDADHKIESKAPLVSAPSRGNDSVGEINSLTINEDVMKESQVFVNHTSFGLSDSRAKPSWLTSEVNEQKTEAPESPGKNFSLHGTVKTERDLSWLKKKEDVPETSNTDLSVTRKDLTWLTGSNNMDSKESNSPVSQMSLPIVSPTNQSLGTTDKLLELFNTSENVHKKQSGRMRRKDKDMSSDISPTENQSKLKDFNFNWLPDKEVDPKVSDRGFLSTYSLNPEGQGDSLSRKNSLGMKDLNFDFMKDDMDDYEDDFENQSVSKIKSTPSSPTQTDVINKNNKESITVHNTTGESVAIENQSDGGKIYKSKNNDSGEVIQAIHSAVTLFHEKDEKENLALQKQVKKGKKKSKSKQQTGSKTKNGQNKDPIAKEGKRNDVKGKQRHNLVELNTSKKEANEKKQSKDNNANSKGGGLQMSMDSSDPYDGISSTLASSDSVIKVDNISEDNYYGDEFENDSVSLKSEHSSIARPPTQRLGGQSTSYTNTSYGNVYSAFARQPQQAIKGNKTKFPVINVHQPVQLTTGQISVSDQSFSTAVKRKKKPSKCHPVRLDESREGVATSESDSKPGTSLFKHPKVPVPLRSNAVFRNGKLEVSIMDDRDTLQGDTNVDVKITFVHKHINGMHFQKKKKTRKLPKLDFATNRDIVNQRAQYPPFNTHVEDQASERFKHAFGM